MKFNAVAKVGPLQRAGLTSASSDRYGPTANIDVYNVFNGSAVLGANNTYGPLPNSHGCLLH